MSAHLKRALICAATAVILGLSAGGATAKPLASLQQRGPIAPISKPAASPAVCTAPEELARLDYSLDRVAHKILAKQPLTIVAIGSSSTFGVGASSPRMSYPSRLAAELQALFPDSPITVLNRGVNGETTADMLARFDRDVFAAKPDLVIWQVGSNDVLTGLPIDRAAELIGKGLERLKAHGTDVIVIDPQYAPETIKHRAAAMAARIAPTAKLANVNVFQRFAVMRHWRLTENMPFRTFVSKDELHMNDWSYGCMAKLLARAIGDVIATPVVAAIPQPRS